ncbi:MAG: DUF4912 domain-containing protein [Planctomycetota bacterium]
MTRAKLRTHTAKDLAQMARRAGVAGWHGMRKDELIAALLSARSTPGGEPSRPAGPTPAERRKSSAARRKLAAMHENRDRLRDLSTGGDTNQSDQLVVLVRDPYWLHAHWELSSAGIERARKALGQHWHGATPVLRLHHLNEDGSTAGVRQITIHGGVSNWYLDVIDPPRKYRAEIGYAALGGGFYCLARSNEVVTPAPGSADAVDDNWSDVARNADRVFAMSGGYSDGGASVELQQLLEHRLRRRLGRPSETRFGAGASGGDESRMNFAVDAEIIVYGSAETHAHVTVQGEPVTVRPDGEFAVKLPFPDRRQVIPVVASSPDGVQQQTIILGVERNTKRLDRRRSDPAAG